MRVSCGFGVRKSATASCHMQTFAYCLPMDRLFADCSHVEFIGRPNGRAYQQLKAASDEKKCPCGFQVLVKEEDTSNQEKQAGDQVVEYVCPLIYLMSPSFITH
jgi:DNA-directed RNA polymerase subunit RPC12/RpoP